jgi:hypothetical protein
MYHERERMESLGYRFEIDEEPVTEPGSTADTYYVVTILRDGEVLGTRSEINYDHALERAIEFAEKHNQGGEPKGLMPKGWTDRPVKS